MSENTKVTAKQTEKKQFPTEFIDPPSKGWFYPEGHPLASGQVELKYMTAREEDILTSPNLLKQGTAIDKLLEALIVDKKIKLDDDLLKCKSSCPVCLEKFKDNEFKRELKCGHVFHKKCIDKWIKHQNSCPICRKQCITIE